MPPTVFQEPSPDAAASEKSASARSFAASQIGHLVRRMPTPVVALAVASVVAGLAEAGILAILAQAAVLLTNHKSSVEVDVGPVRLHAALLTLLALGGAFAVGRLLLGLLISFVPAWIADSTQARLRSDLFAAFSAASWDVQSREREGHFQELVTNQVGQATQAYAITVQLITSVLTFFVLVISAVALSPLAAFGIILVVGALALVLRPLGELGHRRSRALSQGWLAYAAGVNEAVRLAEEAHIFGVEARQRERVEELVKAFRKPNLHSNWLAGLIPSVYQSFIYLLLIVALVALHALHPGHIASLGVVVLMLVRSGAYGQQMQSSLQSLRQSQPYVERLDKAERRYRDSAMAEGNRPLVGVQELSFEAVSFSYDPDKPILKVVDFRVAGGEAVGIVGPSGAGKSTLVQILLGLRVPTLGEYLVNGIPARELSRDDWRRAFAYVPQEPRVLHASVADNIRFFRDLSDEDVERAARYAGIHDEIMSWRRGYETVIGPRADAVSGGQQQRVCLARALAGSPRVLVLDEPTSALDPLTEQRIQESLIHLKERLTLFVVAHRMSTLDVCDRVMVIVDGKLEAFAPATDLSADNDYYRSAIEANLASNSRESVRMPHDQ